MHCFQPSSLSSATCPAYCPLVLVFMVTSAANDQASLMASMSRPIGCPCVNLRLHSCVKGGCVVILFTSSKVIQASSHPTASQTSHCLWSSFPNSHSSSSGHSLMTMVLLHQAAFKTLTTCLILDFFSLSLYQRLDMRGISCHLLFPRVPGRTHSYR